jgi:hypothetical protein
MSYLEDLKFSTDPKTPDTSTDTSSINHDDLIRAVLDAPEEIEPTDDAFDEVEHRRELFKQHRDLVESFRNDFGKEFRKVSQLLKEKQTAEEFQTLLDELSYIRGPIIRFQDLDKHPLTFYDMVYCILKAL